MPRTGSNHYGIAGYYGLMAKDAGYIGISMTNTSPLVVSIYLEFKLFNTTFQHYFI